MQPENIIQPQTVPEPPAVISPTPMQPPMPEPVAATNFDTTPVSTPSPVLSPELTTPPTPMQPPMPQPTPSLSMDSMSPPPAPSPVTFGAPQSGFATPAPMSQANVPSAAKPKISKKLLIIIGAIVVVIGALAILWFTVLHRPITLSDVNSFSTTQTNFVTDWSAAEKSFESALSDTATSSLSTDLKATSTKLADTQKQFKTLKTSIVLNNSAVNKAFSSYSSSYSVASQFLGNEVIDISTGFYPAIIQYGTDLNALNKSDLSTAAALTTYLTSFKSDTDAVLAKFSSTPMLTSQDQKLENDTKTFLKSVDSDISAAIGDLSLGNQAALNTDFNNIVTTGDNSSTTLNTDTQAIDNNLLKIDPLNNTSLDTAINNLLSTLVK